MIQIRRCVGCNDLKPQSELLKIQFANETKDVHLQPSNKLHGRSSYICYNKTCILTCLKKGKLEKSLRKKVKPEILEMLQRIAK